MEPTKADGRAAGEGEALRDAPAALEHRLAADAQGDARVAADVFGLTYREHAAAREVDYRWRVVAPEALSNLRRADRERWSTEKLADYLHSDAAEAALRLRRFLMSERVNAGESTPERLNLLFREWLARFEPDAGERRELARDLSRLLSSQLHRAAEAGETLDDLIDGLEKAEGGDAAPKKEAEPRSWGPQWKD